MNRKTYDLMNKRAEMIEEASAALDAGKMEEYRAKLDDVQKMNAEIEAQNALDAERGRFDASNLAMLHLHNAQKQEKEDQAAQNRLDEARSGNEYARAFAEAIRNGDTIKTGVKNEGYRPLYNALTIGGGSPAGSDGGFLVPIDFDDMIHRKMKDFIRLADYFNVESVSGYNGWRAVEKNKAGTPLPNIDEAAAITPTDQPAFEKVEYAVKKFGDIIIISSELAEDNTAGLMQYLSEWFAPKVVLTENKLLLDLLATLTAKNLTSGSEVKSIKQALNKNLNTAHSRRAVLLCNQDSYNFLDELEDANRRGLLIPDPTQPDAYRFKGRPVAYADNDLIPSRTVSAAGAAKGDYYPLYIGDFKSYGTLFSRKALEFAATNIGGSAWRTDTTEVRGIVRMDAKTMDATAAVLREIFIPATSGT